MIIILLICIVLSAFFSASETSIFSLRHSEVRLMERNKERNAHLLAKLKGDPHRVLVTILTGNTIVNIATGSLSAVIAMEASQSLSVGVAMGISTVCILIFGEIFPKSLAITHNKRLARIIAPPIYICYLALYPISSLFVWVEKKLKEHLESPEHSMVSEEEIRIMAEMGLEHGEIDRHERDMIENIFQFDDITVADIMTPKARIDALSGEVPVSQIAYYVSQSGFSRFPVYEGNANEYIGYVHTNDVMRVLNSDDRDELLMNYVSPLLRVPASMNLRTAFHRMTKERSHIFLVHETGDEKRVVGLVTMENLLEEIVGEIEDEGDKRSKRRPMRDSV